MSSFTVKNLHDYFTINKIKSRVIVYRDKAGPINVHVLIKVREDRLNQVITDLEMVRPAWITFEYGTLNLWDHIMIGKRRKTRLELR